MNRFDLYMMAQLIRLFGFFGLVLVGIYWINQAVLLFDQLIADGHSIVVFLELTVLSLPPMLLTVLPFATFAASMTVMYRMINDSELTALRAAGASPWRLTRPVAAFGGVIAAFMLILAHVVAPTSESHLHLRKADLTRDQTARLLTAGSFVKAEDGLTVFIGENGENGALFDVLISDMRNGQEPIMHIASEGVVYRKNGRLQLRLIDGMTQSLDQRTAQLTVTRYDTLTYDIQSLLSAGHGAHRPPRSHPTLALMRADDDLQRATGKTQSQLRFIAANRFNQAALAFAAALIGFTPLLVGGLNRLGIARQMMVAGGIVLVILILDGAVRSAGNAPDGSWQVAGLSSLAGVGLAVVPIWLAAAGRFKIRRPA